MKTVRKLRDHGATIILLHHTKKSEDDVYKGSTAIFDLVDYVLGLYPFKKEKIKSLMMKLQRVLRAFSFLRQKIKLG